MNCGHWFLILAFTGLIPITIIYRRLHSNHPEVAQEIANNGFLGFCAFTPSRTFFVVFGHWKLKDNYLSVACVTITATSVLVIMAFFGSSIVCTGVFRIG